MTRFIKGNASGRKKIILDGYPNLHKEIKSNRNGKNVSEY